MKYYFAIVIAAFAAITSHAQQCTLKITGHVEDADTKEKLRSATIQVVEQGTRFVTDARGDFILEGLCAGHYSIIVSHAGCEPYERKINLVKDMHLDILLPHARKVLGEVTVEAQKAIANTGFRKEITAKELDETRGLSLAEALGKMNGVSILQSGSNISKPVIHGLHSSRILTINNGVRQEGQQWGNEHAPEIDPFISDKLTIIKGVDELRYGSDAIGGVILVEPRPLRNRAGYGAEVNTVYFSNNRQYVVSAQFEQQLKKLPAFRYRIQGTYKKAANISTPGYRLNNTGSEENNYSIAAGWKKKSFSTEAYYSHFNVVTGIFPGSHIGNLSDLIKAIEAPKPADVFLGENTYSIRRPRQEATHDLIKSKTVLYSGNHKFSLLLAGQYNRRMEYDIVRNPNTTAPQLDLLIYTFTEDLGWEFSGKNNFSSQAGVSLMQQDNSYGGRYFIPNYLSNTAGGYFIEKWRKHTVELQAGLRFDNKRISTTRLKYNGEEIDYDFNFSTFAASFNAIYKPGMHWKLNTGMNLSSRAPYVNELLSDGIHHGTATYEKGDINLRPERSVNISAGVNYVNTSGTFELDALCYANRINDFIYQQPMPDSPVLTIAGAFPLMRYTQADAMLSGFDITATVKPLAGFEWVPKISVLYARNRSMNDWLILMPANRLGNELSYSFKNSRHFTNSYVSLEMINVMKQERIPGQKNGKTDYKEPPPGYSLFNAQASVTVPVFKIPVTVSAGVRNLFNTRYRDYLNSMRYFTDESGRNISIRLQVKFDNSK